MSRVIGGAQLQSEQPGDCPDGLLRTVQCRLKFWRSEQARALVFTHASSAPAADTASQTMVDG
jgi:hypothetical protein